MAVWRWALTVVLVFALGIPARGADPIRAPNIVLILADDLGYGDLGCYGHPQFKTPNLDRLATEGARLTHFNTPMPYCAPTRASLLTGRYPFRNGMVSNPAPDGGPNANALALNTEEVTLAQLLKASGYATGMVGKWHLGHQKNALPTHRGFDEYFGIPYSNDMRPVKLFEGDVEVEYPVTQATLTKRYTERAIQFVNKNKDRPFFLYFPHTMPHKPLAASDDFYKKSRAGLYGDVIAELDVSIGKLMAELRKLDLEKNTLVIFTSDNGPWFGGSTGGLRGMKATSWEGGYRVPCLVRWPYRVPAGKVFDSPCVMMDLFSTILAATGVAPPSNRVIDGVNLLPMLTGQGPPPHDVIFGMQGAALAVVRDDRWKLHVLPVRETKFGKDGERWIDPRGPDGTTILAPLEQYQPTDYPGLRTGDAVTGPSLFDLKNDPGEQHNVAAQHPEIVTKLRAKFDEIVKQFPATDPAKRKS